MLGRPTCAPSASLAVLARGRGRDVPFLGEEFLPNFKEHDFLMHWVEKPGTSLPAMRRITVRAAKELTRDSRRRRASARTSAAPKRPTRSSASNSPSCGSASTARSTTRPRCAKVQAGRGRLPGSVPRPAHVSAGAHQRGADRRQRDDRRAHLRSRSRRRCSAQAAKVESAIEGIGGRRRPEGAGAGAGAADRGALQARDRAQPSGCPPGDVRRAATTLVQGTRVGEIYEDQKVFDVVVRGAAGVRDSIEAVRRLPIQTAGRRRSCRSAPRPTCRSRRRRTRSRARAVRAGST